MFYTKDNHFKFGYDGCWFQTRTHAAQRYTIEFGRCHQVPQDWRTETVNAARSIAGTAEQPIHVLYSGGIDSEVTLLGFLAGDVPVTADIMRFAHGLNDHDICYAVAFCQRHAVPYHIHEIDIVEFFAGPMYEYAAISHCVSPQLCATMWLVDQIDGHAVLGQGECVLVLHDGQWKFRESEKVNAWYRFYMARRRAGVPGFHQYTPEQMLSFLLDPTFTPYMTTASGKTSNKSLKHTIYNRYFPVQARPKYTGFENVQAQDDHHRARLLQLYAEWDDVAMIPVADFIASLQPVLHNK